MINLLGERTDRNGTLASAQEEAETRGAQLWRAPPALRKAIPKNTSALLRPPDDTIRRSVQFDTLFTKRRMIIFIIQQVLHTARCFDVSFRISHTSDGLMRAH